MLISNYNVWIKACISSFLITGLQGSMSSKKKTCCYPPLNTISSAGRGGGVIVPTVREDYNNKVSMRFVDIDNF